MAVLSERLKEALLKGFPDDVDCPFINGKMKFDGICMSNLHDSIGGVKVEFFWRGKPTHWIRVEDAGIKDDKMLTITGITGEQDFTVV
jgi:hypothetical protein